MKKGKKLLLVLSVGFLLAGCSCSNGEPINPPQVNVEDEQGSQSLAKMYQESVSSTVAVYGYNGNSNFSLGTGIVYKEEGGYAYIITNAHVLYNKSTATDFSNNVEVLFSNYRRAKANFIGMDKNEDVAVLRIEKSKENYTVAKFVNDDLSTKEGDWVYAIGNPNGDLFSITKGTITKTRKEASLNYIGNSNSKTFVYNSDATINPGNSGGPLFNFKGEVVAINAMIPGDQNNSRDNNFSIPVNHCLTVADYIVAHAGSSTPFHRAELKIQEAVAISSLPSEQRPGIVVDNGILVKRSSYDGVKNVVITHIGGIPVKTLEDLNYLLFTKYLTSKSVELTIVNTMNTSMNTIVVDLY